MLNGATPTLEQVCALPKIELHAHLSGCITQKKLSELVTRRGTGETFEPFDCRVDLSNALEKCFDYFAKVALVISDLASLKESALHVLETFASDNCLYLELRTSPKQFKMNPKNDSVNVTGNTDEPSSLTTKLQYLATIKEAIDEFQATARDRFGFVMEVTILLSVDRGKVTSKQSALEQIDDVLKMQASYPELVVGIDICGNPSAPTVVPFLIPALLERKDSFLTLPITFHTAEIKDDEESQLVLDNMRALNIRRLGHVCFFPDHCRQRVLDGSIHADGGPVGIEVCPTSNLVTRELKAGLHEHHFLDWWKKSDNVLVSVNSDDTGLFSCTLSSEIHDLATAFHLSWEDLVNLQRQALQSSFHPDKQRLLNLLEERLSFGGTKHSEHVLEGMLDDPFNPAKKLKLNGLKLTQ